LQHNKKCYNKVSGCLIKYLNLYFPKRYVKSSITI